MGFDAVNMRCPYCNHAAHFSVLRQSDSMHPLRQATSLGFAAVRTHFMVCPNDKCLGIQLSATLFTGNFNQASQWIPGKLLKTWKLLPHSDAIAFPNYVPEAIRSDYEEACAIVDLSPKASATLSRRCLQGLLRDFWKVKPVRLVDEIKEVEPKIDSTTWAAIDALRNLGNIGAHMEKDINVIVDVDPGEAEALLRLLESLVEEWYIGRHDREARMNAVIAAAAGKKPVPPTTP